MAEVIPITSHPAYRAAVIKRAQSHSCCTQCGGVVGERDRCWVGTTIGGGRRVLFCSGDCFARWNAGGQS